VSRPARPDAPRSAPQTSLEDLAKLRADHERLCGVALKTSGAVLADELADALAALAHVCGRWQWGWPLTPPTQHDAFSPDFAPNKHAYELRVDHVESRLTSQLVDALDACRQHEDMFRVCARFNALFSRPRVRAAVQQFQARLLATVEHELQGLGKRLAGGYEDSEQARLALALDIPVVVGASCCRGVGGRC
jgi:hypothetical protein